MLNNFKKENTNKQKIKIKNSIIKMQKFKIYLKWLVYNLVNFTIQSTILFNFILSVCAIISSDMCL